MPGALLQRILLSQAEPGMVLARPVQAPRQKDSVLYGEGTELNEEVITRLMLRGIKRVWVEGSPLPLPPRDPPQELRAALRRRFARAEASTTLLRVEELVAELLERRR